MQFTDIPSALRGLADLVSAEGDRVSQHTRSAANELRERLVDLANDPALPMAERRLLGNAAAALLRACVLPTAVRDSPRLAAIPLGSAADRVRHIATMLERADDKPLAREDKLILLALRNAGAAMVQVEIEAETQLSRKTVGQRLKVLRERGLVAPPEGMKNQNGLTAKGRDRLDAEG